MMFFSQKPKQNEHVHNQQNLQPPPYFSIFLFFNSASGSGVGQQLRDQ